ncbi:general substrate transporter [Kockovaella imperatae]|uniref:General substrate transporter n=1 Tax=Kockovaella imperatae TaxID=4999 RepID=A0A1Y1UQH9_9TREE|nr:general substrate transporter [Kockovaella imperatae]ORX40328.1 general substrate transporter [Kockovaella imperatae]
MSAHIDEKIYDEKEQVAHLAVGELPKDAVPGLPNVTWAELKEEAERAEEYEHSLTVWQSIKTYKAAVGWAAAASLSIVMEGYDTALLGSFWGLPAFREHYGEWLPDKQEYQVPAPWQIGIGQASTVGNFLGIFWGSFLIDRFGYRKSLLLNLFLMIPFIGIVTFAPSKVVLLVGEFLCGIPWGVFSTLAEAYSSEVCPLTLRGYLTTYVNLCWVIGQFISAGVLVGIQGMTGRWSYRLPFAIQWAWPVPLLILIYLSPESPWWLVRHGRLDEAETSVRRLASADMRDRARNTVAMMVRTNQLEVDVSEGTRYIDCFRGTDLRRTEISTVAWACQQLCGLPFAGWAVYFFQQAGVSNKMSYNLGLINTAGAFCGTVGSWFLITKFGRRSLFLAGMSWLAAGQLLIGILSIVADKTGATGAKYGQAAVMLIWVFSYDFTIGPLAYCIVGEASSTRLRNKTVGLSRNAYNILGVIAGIITPYMLNPGQWNWAGKTGFFWAPIATSMVVWTYFRLPEFKGRSYYELDVLFERRVKAKDFSTTFIEQNADEHITGNQHRRGSAAP